MLTNEAVREVSRTGQPATVAGFTLTVEYLVRNTTGNDWEGSYVILKKSAAGKIAAQLNKAQPWRNAERIRAIAGAPKRELMVAEVLEAELVA